METKHQTVRYLTWTVWPQDRLQVLDLLLNLVSLCQKTCYRLTHTHTHTGDSLHHIHVSLLTGERLSLSPVCPRLSLHHQSLHLFTEAEDQLLVSQSVSEPASQPANQPATHLSHCSEAPGPSASQTDSLPTAAPDVGSGPSGLIERETWLHTRTRTRTHASSTSSTASGGLGENRFYVVNGDRN